jgi:hypothetical protein
MGSLHSIHGQCGHVRNIILHWRVRRKSRGFPIVSALDKKRSDVAFCVCGDQSEQGRDDQNVSTLRATI